MSEDMNFNFDNKVVEKKPFPTKILIICIAVFLIILAGILTFVFVFNSKTNVEFSFYLNNNKVSENLDVVFLYNDKNVEVETIKDKLDIRLPKNKDVTLKVLTVGYQFEKTYFIDTDKIDVKITKPTTVAELQGEQETVDFLIYKFPNTTQIYSQNIILNLTCNTSRKTENISVNGRYSYTKPDNCGSLTVKLINDAFKPITQTCGSSCRIILYDKTEPKLEEVLTKAENDLLVIVKDNRRNELEDANVNVYQNNNLVASGVTDSEGKVLIKNLDLGKYTIKAEYVKYRRTYSKVESNYELKQSNTAQELDMVIRLYSGGGSSGGSSTGSSDSDTSNSEEINDFNLDVSLTTFDNSYCETGFPYTLYDSDGNLESFGNITEELALTNIPKGTYYLTINPFNMTNINNPTCFNKYSPIYNYEIVLNANKTLEFNLDKIIEDDYSKAFINIRYKDIAVKSNIKVYDKEFPKIPLLETYSDFIYLYLFNDRNYFATAEKGIYHGELQNILHNFNAPGSNTINLESSGKNVLLSVLINDNNQFGLNYTSNDINYDLSHHASSGDFNIVLDDSSDIFKFYTFSEHLLFYFPLKYSASNPDFEIEFNTFNDKNYDINTEIVYLDKELTIPVDPFQLQPNKTYYLPINIKSEFNKENELKVFFNNLEDDFISDYEILGYFDDLDSSLEKYVFNSTLDNGFEEYYSRILIEFTTIDTEESVSDILMLGYNKTPDVQIKLRIIQEIISSDSDSVTFQEYDYVKDLIDDGLNSYDALNVDDARKYINVIDLNIPKPETQTASLWQYLEPGTYRVQSSNLYSLNENLFTAILENILFENAFEIDVRNIDGNEYIGSSDMLLTITLDQDYLSNIVDLPSQFYTNLELQLIKVDEDLPNVIDQTKSNAILDVILQTEYVDLPKQEMPNDFSAFEFNIPTKYNPDTVSNPMSNLSNKTAIAVNELSTAVSNNNFVLDTSLSKSLNKVSNNVGQVNTDMGKIMQQSSMQEEDYISFADARDTLEKSLPDVPYYVTTNTSTEKDYAPVTTDSKYKTITIPLVININNVHKPNSECYNELISAAGDIITDLNKVIVSDVAFYTLPHKDESVCDNWFDNLSLKLNNKGCELNICEFKENEYNIVSVIFSRDDGVVMNLKDFNVYYINAEEYNFGLKNYWNKDINGDIIPWEKDFKQPNCTKNMCSFEMFYEYKLNDTLIDSEIYMLPSFYSKADKFGKYKYSEYQDIESAEFLEEVQDHIFYHIPYVLEVESGFSQYDVCLKESGFLDVFDFNYDSESPLLDCYSNSFFNSNFYSLVAVNEFEESNYDMIALSALFKERLLNKESQNEIDLNWSEGILIYDCNNEHNVLICDPSNNLMIAEYNNKFYSHEQLFKVENNFWVSKVSGAKLYSVIEITDFLEFDEAGDRVSIYNLYTLQDVIDNYNKNYIVYKYEDIGDDRLYTYKWNIPKILEDLVNGVDLSYSK